MPSVDRARGDVCAWLRRAGRTAFFAALACCAAACFPGMADAEGFGGYLEAGYNTFSTKFEDAAGNTTTTDNSTVAQRYNLFYTRNLAPYLKLYAGGLFEKIDTESVTNGSRSESTVTTTQPSVDLTMRTPIYLAGLKFTRRTETASSTGSPETTHINDFYQGIAGWKPPDRFAPSFEVRLSRSQIYDEEKQSTNIVTDFAGLIMNYTPTDTLFLRYSPSYSKGDNRLSGLEAESVTHAGIVQYSDRFLQNRISVGANYNFSFGERKVSVRGTGVVDTDVVPFSGLSSIDDTPTDGTLAANPALIDGNRTASAGINIGLPPFGGDARERNIGLDFAFAKEVNKLLVWVDRPLPVAIADSFSWSIYTSADNVTWSFLATVFPAPFGTFDNRFEIGFSSVITRYIKVVVHPLSPTVSGASSFPDIFVTELEAFVSASAEQVRGKRTSSNQLFSFDGRALLIEKNPNLYYLATYLVQRSESGSLPSQEKTSLYNALQAAHRFGRVFSGLASVGREDFTSTQQPDGHAYIANTSLDAVPLRSLHHTLSYSGRFEKRDDGSTDTNSIYLNNTAHVYTGVFMTAAGGLNFTHQGTGERQKSTELSASTNIEPHRTVSLTYQVLSRYTEVTGGQTAVPSTRRTDNVVGATYHPVETLYLVYGRSALSEPQRTLRVTNYGLNWSPSLGSSLQFTFNYSETLSSEDNAKSTLYGPSLIWKFARTANLTVQYQVLRSESDTGRSDTDSFSTTVKAYF